MDKIIFWSRIKAHALAILLTLLFVVLFLIILSGEVKPKSQKYAEMPVSTSIAGFSDSGVVQGVALPNIGVQDSDYSGEYSEGTELAEDMIAPGNVPAWRPLIAGEDQGIYSILPPVSNIGNSVGATLPDRKIIKNGWLSLIVENIEQGIQTIESLAHAVGGRIDSVSYDNTGSFSKKSATVKVRVPSEEFDQVVQVIKNNVLKVERENITTSDVTSQFIDMEARLKNLHAEEKQYQDILKDAVKIPDVLQVSQRLFIVRQQIEQIEAQIANLSGEIAMSTISITLSSEPDVKPLDTVWRPLSVMKQAFAGLVLDFQHLADGVIYFFVRIFPALVIWIAVLILIVWLLVVLVFAKMIRALKIWLDRAIPLPSRPPTSVSSISRRVSPVSARMPKAIATAVTSQNDTKAL